MSYTLHELSRDWKVSYSTLWRMINDGRLAAFKVGATWRVKAAERERIENKFSTSVNSEQ